MQKQPLRWPSTSHQKKEIMNDRERQVNVKRIFQKETFPFIEYGSDSESGILWKQVHNRFCKKA